jgi:hypothetical protein
MFHHGPLTRENERKTNVSIAISSTNGSFIVLVTQISQSKQSSRRSEPKSTNPVASTHVASVMVNPPKRLQTSKHINKLYASNFQNC